MLKFQRGDRIVSKLTKKTWLIYGINPNSFNTYWLADIAGHQPAAKAISQEIAESGYDLIPDPNNILKGIL